MEQLRRIVRGAIGYENSVYRAAAVGLNTAEIVRKEGLDMLSNIRRIESAAVGGACEQVKFRNLLRPIDVRPGTKDLVTVVDTVVREEYGKWPPRNDIGVLVDAGAFIGDTSAWYLSRFPQLRTWALEPMPDNFELARRNLGRYGDRATVLPLALAGSEGTVRFEGGGTGGSIGGDNGIEVKTTCMPALLATIPGGHIDVLKIDIEGAEVDVFEAAPQQWLGKVDRIIVELHGPEIARKVHAILDANGWGYRQYRSVWYCAPKGR